jgi:hypothetical protein
MRAKLDPAADRGRRKKFGRFLDGVQWRDKGIGSPLDRVGPRFRKMNGVSTSA